ncbi:hypothetical protein [Streptomyces hyaluromycini]|uniref:hypothetical protein n=1 Tax=Streptomyces hyaluromycini TaxID=1377993 RepID=UPI001237D5C7|nr:hypothetical protein [Streptomyces hyaluromycini]
MAATRAGALGVAEFLAGIGVLLFDVNLNSLHSTVNYGIRPIGAIVGGTLATLIGPRPTLITAAVGGTLSLLWLLPSSIPRIRSLAPHDPLTADGATEADGRPAPQGRIGQLLGSVFKGCWWTD